MTAILAFLRVAWPYLVTAAAGAFISHEIDNIPYSRLQAARSADQTRWAQEEAQRQKDATEALQAQIKARLTTEANNSAVIENLQNANAQIAADRDGTLTRVRRLEQLLVLASRQTAGRGGVSQTGSGSGATTASGDAGPSEAERLLIDAKEEAERNAARLNALIAQIEPQL